MRRGLEPQAAALAAQRRTPDDLAGMWETLGRMADPLEVGRVAVFLASDLASYVSGARVACDGGGEPPVFLHIT